MNRLHKNKKETRREPSRCPVSKKCGGCQYIDLEYKDTLEIKKQWINKLLGDLGHVEEVVGMENPFHYRNKVTATFKHKGKGEIISGIYEEGSHFVIPIDDCLIEDALADRIIVEIRNMLKSFKITVYNEDTGYGILKHVMVRVGKNSGEVMVIMITSTPIFPSKKNFCKALKEKFPEITTIVQNINPKHTTMVLGERNEILFGPGFIYDTLCGKRFKLSPNSFYQINTQQTEKLYRMAIDMANLSSEEVLIDAYCGIGTIGIVASDYVKKVIGIELNKSAIKDAIVNAKINKCENVTFYTSDAGKFMINLAEENAKIDAVIMDPPRSGSDESFMKSVIALNPKKILYISCGPESLVRDLRYIMKHSSYKIKEIKACDMFGFTDHVECIACIQRERGNED